jgi:hypothetical protein
MVCTCYSNIHVPISTQIHTGIYPQILQINIHSGPCIGVTRNHERSPDGEAPAMRSVCAVIIVRMRVDAALRATRYIARITWALSEDSAIWAIRPQDCSDDIVERSPGTANSKGSPIAQDSGVRLFNRLHNTGPAPFGISELER